MKRLDLTLLAVVLGAIAFERAALAFERQASISTMAVPMLDYRLGSLGGGGQYAWGYETVVGLQYELTDTFAMHLEGAQGASAGAPEFGFPNHAVPTFAARVGASYDLTTDHDRLAKPRLSARLVVLAGLDSSESIGTSEQQRAAQGAGMDPAGIAPSFKRRTMLEVMPDTRLSYSFSSSLATFGALRLLVRGGADSAFSVGIGLGIGIAYAWGG